MAIVWISLVVYNMLISVKCNDANLQKQIYDQMRDIYKQQQQINTLQMEKNAQQLEINEQRSQLRTLENQVQQLTNDRGVNYVRWGRTTCPQSAQIVYKGHMGGTHFLSKGGGSNYLCLPEHPEYGSVVNGLQHEARIYGSEYEFYEFESMFSKANNGGMSLINFDALCVVCFVPARSAQIMIPAKKTCPAGWTMEYQGYLMSERYDYNQRDFICLDGEPNVRPGSGYNHDGALLLPVEGVCGSLPCPPYVNGWELTCVVCTK